jgi:DNA-binding MarR family transcriptional regulator
MKPRGRVTSQTGREINQCKSFGSPAAGRVGVCGEGFPEGKELVLDGHVDLDAETLRIAKLLYEARRRRDAASSVKGLFGEPGWDILLDLFIARKTRTALQVSSVCAGAGLPSTTVLRWIARLEREGLIVRVADVEDARRRYVSLTTRGLRLTTNLLDAIGSIG